MISADRKLYKKTNKVRKKSFERLAKRSGISPEHLKDSELLVKLLCGGNLSKNAAMKTLRDDTGAWVRFMILFGVLNYRKRFNDLYDFCRKAEKIIPPLLNNDGKRYLKYCIGYAYYVTGRHKRALEYFNDCMRSGLSYPKLYHYSVISNIYCDRMDEGSHLLKKAVKAFPDHKDDFAKLAKYFDDDQ
jgi:hypothetical protein